MSVNLAGKGYKCWRNREHAGKNPARLIQALLSCSWEQAARYAGHEKVIPSDFLSKVRGSLVIEPANQIQHELSLPPEFKQFRGLPSSKPFVQYLLDRGFSELQIKRTPEYGIYYASLGSMKGRIVFTVWFEGKLVGWTGRTIYKDEDLRYKTLSNNPEKGPPTAPRPISDYLLFWDLARASRAHTLVLCEGPFDAWKVNVLGGRLGVVAVCLFTNSASVNQLCLLHELLPQFSNTIILLDQHTAVQASRLRDDLSVFGAVIKRLPAQYKDPGEVNSVDDLQKIVLG